MITQEDPGPYTPRDHVNYLLSMQTGNATIWDEGPIQTRIQRNTLVIVQTEQWV
jgi:hypothetical protein